MHTSVIPASGTALLAAPGLLSLTPSSLSFLYTQVLNLFLWCEITLHSSSIHTCKSYLKMSLHFSSFLSPVTVTILGHDTTIF